MKAKETLSPRLEDLIETFQEAERGSTAAQRKVVGLQLARTMSDLVRQEDETVYGKDSILNRSIGFAIALSETFPKQHISEFFAPPPSGRLDREFLQTDLAVRMIRVAMSALAKSPALCVVYDCSAISLSESELPNLPDGREVIGQAYYNAPPDSTETPDRSMFLVGASVASGGLECPDMYPHCSDLLMVDVSGIYHFGRALSTFHCDEHLELSDFMKIAPTEWIVEWNKALIADPTNLTLVEKCIQSLADTIAGPAALSTITLTGIANACLIDATKTVMLMVKSGAVPTADDYANMANAFIKKSPLPVTAAIRMWWPSFELMCVTDGHGGGVYDIAEETYDF